MSEEDDNLGDNSFVWDEEEGNEGEDLYGDNLIEDYKAVPVLDRYDFDDIDDEEYDQMTDEQRFAAEQALLNRDHIEQRRFENFPVPSSSDEGEDIPRRLRRSIEKVSVDRGKDTHAIMEDEEEDTTVILEEHKGPIREFLQLEATRREVKRRFKAFLTNFTDEHKQPIYMTRIQEMCVSNKGSLEVSYLHLSAGCPVLAIWLADHPGPLTELFDEVCMACALRFYKNYQMIQKQCHVRFTHLPVMDKITDLRNHHLRTLVKVEGVVIRRTAVFPQLRQVKYNCFHCDATIGPFTQTHSDSEAKPSICPECQTKGPFVVNDAQTIFQNYQKVVLQESPGSVPAGRVPRQIEVILLDDLVDCVRPGELIEVTGIYKHTYSATLNAQQGFPLFSVCILANHITKATNEMDRFLLNDEDVQNIRKLAQNKDIIDVIVRSMAPSIYGHDNVKLALALSMFGGQPKELSNRSRIRGDINVLLLGDPGVAKSQFLKYVEKTSARCVYTTGKGASAVGLTASVHKDKVSGEFVLEGGALVLADTGICCIDEFDKMSEQDRTSIHEAMEQQTISISKAGIVASLKARCAIIAAANPLQGRYNSQLTLMENVNLSEPILSRFDIVLVLRDVVDLVHDTHLAEFVVRSHVQAHPHFSVLKPQLQGENKDPTLAADVEYLLSDFSGPSATTKTIDQALLRKYIIYARQHVHPRINMKEEDKVAKLYADLRKESASTGGILITARHLESLIRIAEALARMRLSDQVNDDDFNMAIHVVLDSFISSQKFSVMRTLKQSFRKYLSYREDHFHLLLHVLNQLVHEQIAYRRLQQRGLLSEADNDGLMLALKQHPVEIEIVEFQAKAKELGISDVEPFLASNLFTANKFVLNKQEKVIKKLL